MSRSLQDTYPFAGHSPEQYRPLGGYGALLSTYFGGSALFVTWLKRSGRTLPDQVDGRDLVLLALATHKLARLTARDRVTSVARAPFTTFQSDAGPGEVNEAARGTGLQRAIGELIVCPHCLALWVASGLFASYITAPRMTRMITSVFAVVTASDLLQIGYAKAASEQ